MKIISKCLIIIIIFNMIFSINISSVDAVIYNDLPVSTISEEFPDSYKPYIDALKEVHPSWVFKAVYTGVDFNTAILHETYETNLGISLVPESYSNEWKKTEGTIARDGSFVTASKEAVKYVLDPRNSLNETYVFQFETLSYTENTLSATEKILKSTPMGSDEYMNKYKSLNMPTGEEWITMDKSYHEIINEVGKKYDVNTVHIASRIKQETSGDILNNKSINGSYSGFYGYYNFFNIDATPGDGYEAIYNGLNHAKSEGWDTPEKSIDAGVAKIADSYIRWGQDTVYFQKFDVNNPGSASYLFRSQYMTNIIAPRSEAISIYNGYSNAGLLEETFEFHIPVYENMPETACVEPSSSTAEFTIDNTKVYLDDPLDSGVPDTFTIRTSPYFNSSNILTTIIETEEGADNRTILTRVLKGPENSYDKVILPDGREGYIFNKYVYEYIYTKVESVEITEESYDLEKGLTYNLNYNVLPENAKYKGCTFKSSDTDIATVNSEGVITGISVGNAVVTVTSEDQSKKDTIEITVYEKQDITLDKDIYNLFVDESIDFTVTCEEEYTISILDENIAVIDDGKIKGVSLGETKIKAYLNSDESKFYESDIKVNEVLDITFDSSLNLNNKTFPNIQINTLVSNLKSKITTNLTYEIRDINNNVLQDDSRLGTGTKIIFSNGEEYIIVVKGDSNGDGMITALDYVKIKNHIMETKLLNEVQKSGADYSSDGQITALDYVKIKNYIMSN